MSWHLKTSVGWVRRRGELLLRPVGEGLTRSLWRLPASSGRTARWWGATGRGLGVLRVGGAFVQYAQPVVSRSRFPPRIAVFRTTNLPRVPVRTSVSEAMTLTCLTSEETTQSRTATWTTRAARVGVMQADLVQILRMSRSAVWGAWCFSGRGIFLPRGRHVDASSS